MTMHAQEIVGAQVTGADGQVVGTVEQVFNDDVDGQPVWARVRAGRRNRFVPLGGSRMAADGIAVPFESQRIVGGPEIAADQHMSAAQAEQLSRYYGLSVPAQGRQPGGGQEQAGQDQAARNQAAQSQAAQNQAAQNQAGQGRDRSRTQANQRPRADADGHGDTAADWLIRAEERLSVGTEVMESGRVRIHKYVDTEPVEQAVHVSHEEYEIEHVPITAEERLTGEIGESERELILHEERAVVRKETVPVERVRLVTKKVQEDRTVRDELRRERIEVEPVGTTSQAGKAR